MNQQDWHQGGEGKVLPSSETRHFERIAECLHKVVAEAHVEQKSHELEVLEHQLLREALEHEGTLEAHRSKETPLEIGEALEIAHEV